MTEAGDDWGRGLWAMADLATPMAVRVAATLRVADHIANGLRTVPELATATDSNTDALDRILRHLAELGILRRDPVGEYSLTARGDQLRDDHPYGLRPSLDIDGAVGRAELSFVQLLHTVRTGEAAYPVQFGKPFWDDLSADPGLAASFDELMGSRIAEDSADIVSAYDWPSLERVVDVGGGNGSLLNTLLAAYSTLRGTVVDLPGPAESARKRLADAGFRDRTDVAPGSFFEELPSGAGAYVLSAIIHNWEDEPAGTILRRCAEAAGSDGKVLVIERFGPEGEASSTEMDLRMLAYWGGRERSLAELTALAAGAGLNVVAVHQAGFNSIVELTVA